MFEYFQGETASNACVAIAPNGLALTGGGCDDGVIGGGVGNGGPRGEVGQPATRLPIDVAIRLVVKADVDESMTE